MPNPSQHKEAPLKPSVTESVQSLIDRKSSDRQSKVSSEVSQKMAGTQEGVADVLAGMEKPSEQVSERKGEGGGQGDLKAGKGTGQGDQSVQQIRSELRDYEFPPEEDMIKHIRSAIQDQIDTEWKQARKLQGKIDQGGAQAYNSSIARIRKMKDLMASLFFSPIEFLKSMYVKYFTPDGKKREIQ
jgi:hypothetical protein